MSCCPKSSSKPSVWLKEEDFGTYQDPTGQVRKVKKFIWTNVQKTTVEMINWGATITSIKVADKHGKVEDIVTGFDTIEEYLGPKNRYYGATIGRVANRIAKGQINVEGVEYKLAINNGPNHLHGGVQGYDKVLWNHQIQGNELVLTYNSPHLEEGYPGDLLATISFQLTGANQFQIQYKAVASRTTPVNLTNHSYFNLAGHGAGSKGLKEHEVTINADRYTEVDPDGIPTGKILDVTGTIFDLRVPRLLADALSRVPNSPGYDHNYCITKPTAQVAFVAKVLHKPSGRVLELFSDQPGVQFYTGNFMPEDGSSQGKGVFYQKHGAFCLETQIYPDAIHHADFPSVLLHPGQEYRHFASFQFLVQQ